MIVGRAIWSVVSLDVDMTSNKDRRSGCLRRKVMAGRGAGRTIRLIKLSLITLNLEGNVLYVNNHNLILVVKRI